MIVEKVCIACEAKFSVKSTRAETAKFCSKLCVIKHKSIDKVCECCGNGFNVPLRRHETVRFCSFACKTENGRKSVVCDYCKKQFSCELHKDQKFCSSLCYHIWSIGSKHAIDPNVERHIKTCAVCSKIFEVNAFRKDSARYCSIKCRANDPILHAQISDKMSGENHPRWTGGLYKTGQGYIRHKVKRLGKETVSMSHRQIMLSWMIEAGCGHPFLIVVEGVIKLSPEIEVHHIDRNRSNNERSNLLALTKTAHYRVHHKNCKPEPWECWPSNPTSW